MPKRGDIVEHRWNHRHPLDVRLTLLVPGIGIVPARTRDISLGGINVHGPGGVLRRNIPVTVILHLREGETLVRHSLRALVIRVREDDAGLMFMDMDRETFRIVGKLLGATPVWTPLPAPIPRRSSAARLRR
jgi:hypothetical protein